jgi:hypothetical protein
MKFAIKKFALGLAVSVLASAAAFAAEPYSLFGESQKVSPGYNSATAVEFSSDASSADPFGGVGFTVPEDLTVADLDQLSAMYKVTAGNCGGGSPRVSVRVTNGTTTGNIFVYLGNPPNYNTCAPNVWTDTGNLLEAADLVDATQLGGSFYQPYSSVQTQFGAFEVVSISLVADGSWAVPGGVQTVVVDNVNVDGTVYTFESAASCRNGGFRLFTTSPGPFRNQGQCVSYFARNRE